MAALLHDVVEDGGGERALAEIGGRFGTDVAAIVKGCSDTTATVEEDWNLRKERYLAHLEGAPPDVLLVSAADKLHNARSISSDLREHGEDVWTRFNRGAKDQLWYYRSLRDVFCRRLPGPLADELDRTVRDINRLVDPDDRIEWLGERFELWFFTDGSSGGTVDWPGRPLAITKERGGLVVHADVACGPGFYPEDDPNDEVDADLGDLWLDYNDDSEVIWLRGHDQGDLHEACVRVATLAPTVARQLAETQEGAMNIPTTTFASRLKHGPWWSTSR